MPCYIFRCKNCNTNFEELCRFEDIKQVRCTKCKSKKLKQLPTICCVKFTNPKDTSKFDNFDYRAKFNYEKAENESRTAKEEARKKGVKSPYADMDDLSSGQSFDPANW